MNRSDRCYQTIGNQYWTAYRSIAILSAHILGGTVTTTTSLTRISPAVVISAFTCLAVFNAEQARSQGQSSDAAGATTGDVPALEEIVVTAQKREQSIQDVPISAAVIGGDTLVKENLNSLEDVARNVPSLTVSSTIGRSGALAMRGVSSGNNPSFDQAVATFVDGIYHGQARMAGAALVDLERVEILRGPQSTFFGNNAIAGALNITSRRPGDTFEGWTRALYGEDGVYALEGAMGGPVTPQFGVRGAVSFTGSDGWLENTVTHQNAPHEKNMGGRVTFAYTPTDDFDATLKIEGSRNRNDSGLYLQFANCATTTTPLSQCLDAFDSDQYGESAGQHADLDTFETVLTANYELGAGLTLTSTTGYHTWDYEQVIDVDVVAPLLLGANTPGEYNQFSQEFRIASPSGGTIEYLAGVYYQSDTLKGETDTLYYLLTPALSANPGFAALVPYLPLGQGVIYDQDQTTVSAFGALTWRLTDRLSLSGGLRYSRVKKSYDYSLYYGTVNGDFTLTPLPDALASRPNVLNLGPTGALSGDRTDDSWMPSAGLQFHFTPQVMGYLSFSRAFLAGGFNYNEVCAGCTAPDASRLPFAPETVNAYEVGLKGEWFDRRLSLGLAVFRSDYKDLQTSATITTGAGALINVVRNAADSVSKGVELDARWLATDNLRLMASVSRLDSYYDEYFFTPTTNLAGQPTGYAPDWSGSVSAEYDFHLPGDFLLTTFIAERFATEQYFSGNASASSLAPEYNRLDARLTLETAGGQWAFDLMGNNLTDERVLTFLNGRALVAAGSSYMFQAQQPRNFAIQARYRF
jgi:outer membrane receptor protein involved in Fe transport